MSRPATDMEPMLCQEFKSEVKNMLHRVRNLLEQRPYYHCYFDGNFVTAENFSDEEIEKASEGYMRAFKEAGRTATYNDILNLKASIHVYQEITF